MWRIDVPIIFCALLAELADALVLETSGAIRGGSNPSRGTKFG
jgi:hypothetical protein